MKVGKFLAAFAAIGWTAATVVADDIETHTYLIGLADAPLAEHARQQLHAAGKSLDADKTAMRRQMASPESGAYVQQLADRQNDLIQTASARVGRSLIARHVYRNVANAIAVELTDSEAAQLASVSGVVSIRRERISHVLTDAGPQWIGANALWNGQVSGLPATKGESIVIGVIDTGINPTHPSFATVGGDGYAHVNPRGHFYGLCATGDATCTQKLIGIYDETTEGSKGIDTVGHGTHVSGIAAGNAMTDALNGITVSLSRAVSGVAPHANLIMYKACTLQNGDGTCQESDLVAAIEQAAGDGVDVINFSIGGDGLDPSTQLNDGSSDGHALFNARAEGVVVVAAAGNDGPGAGSVGVPANDPWVIAAANATHNRVFANSIGNFSGAPNAPATLDGQAFTSGYGPASIVYAGNYGNALCGTGTTEGATPTGKTNPFPAGTFHGEIVICDRGIYGRVEKGFNVKAAGAGGYVLANAVTDGESIISDNHYLPAIHLGYTEGVALKNWVATSGTHQGTIAGVSAVLDDAQGDILNSSSSRGPIGFSGGVLKPDITAPGTNILSSDGSSEGLALMTGTSMASPSVAGSAALIIAEHPTWSPDQVESALTTTGVTTIRLQDGVTPATPLDAGDGKVQPAAAARAGLYFKLSASDIIADYAIGANPSQINRAGIENEKCLGQCAFKRTVTDMSGGGTWQVQVDVAASASVTVSPTQFTLASGGSQALSISANVSDPSLPGTWVYGRITLHKSTGGQSASDTSMPLAIYSSPGSPPLFQNLTASGPGGNSTVQIDSLVALPEATFTTTDLAKATETDMSLGVDPTPNDLYTKFPGTGKQFFLVPITPANAGSSEFSRVLVAEIVSANNNVQLIAGIDANGDGLPESAEVGCVESYEVGVTNRPCVLDLRGNSAVNAWVLVDVPNGNTSSTYTIKLDTGVAQASNGTVGASNQTLPFAVRAVGPGHTSAGESFPLRIFWDGSGDDSLIVPNTPYYGAVMIDSTNSVPSAQAGQVAIVPFRITRAAGGDDVLDALQPTGARQRVLEAGESLQHLFVDVNAAGTLNVTTSLASGAGPISFRAVRADFPASSSSPNIDAAPTTSPGEVQWTLDANTTSKTESIPVTAGRWYIAATNAGSTESQIALQTKLQLTAPVSATPPGSYFNPMRSGHGIFLSPASGQQVLYWYTFLEDGTPAWYAVQGAAPASGDASWGGPLLRVTWDGTKVNSYTFVGDASVTPIDATNLTFSWHIFGVGGSERFTQIGGDACVMLNGASVGLTGQWFAPAQSGYGVDVFVEPSLQFDAFYIYDALGQPRWVAGSSGPFAAAMSATLDQVSGFCPSCAYAAATSQPVGMFNDTFVTPTTGTLSSTLTLSAPVSGTWNVSQPMVRATGATTCSP